MRHMNPACTCLHVESAALSVCGPGADAWACTSCGAPFTRYRPDPLTPWSVLAGVVEERNRYFVASQAAVHEIAALRKQVQSLLDLGVSIHKAASAAVDHERARVDDILTAMVNEGNDAAAEVIGRLARERGEA